MTWAVAAFLLLVFSPPLGAQYLKTSKNDLIVEKYTSVKEEETDALRNEIKEHPGCVARGSIVNA